MEYIVIGCLVYIAFMELLHRKERMDLYNRIMAKDLTDYASASGETKTRAPRNPIARSIEEEMKTYMK